MRRSYNSKSPIKALFFKYFSSAQIYKKNFSRVVNYWILRLDVSVYDIILVKMLDWKHKAAKKVGGYFSADNWHLSYHIEHLFSLDILHEEINILFIVEWLGKSNNVGEHYLCEDLFLLNDAHLHGLLLNCIFWKTLNCV